MKKLIALLCACSMLLLSFTACGKKTEGEKDVVKLTLSEVTHSVFYAPEYVAMEMGFFKEEGIELDLVNAGGTDKVTAALLSNQVQIGLAGPEATLYVYNEGRENNVIFFAQLTKRDGSFLVGRKPDPNFTWDKVKGKNIIGGRVGGVPEMTLEYVLKSHNIIPGKDVNVDTSVQFALMAGAFTGGQGDYVTLFEPTASLVEKEGKGYILTSIGKESGEIPYTGYVASRDYILKNPDIIQRFANAVYKGQQWVATHTPEEIAKAIVSYFPDTTLEVLTTVAKRYQDIDAWCKNPVMQQTAFDRLQTVMSSAGQLKEKVPFDKVINTQFAQTAVDKIK